MTLPLVHDATYSIELQDDHRFPMAKFNRLHTILKNKLDPEDRTVHTPLNDPLPWIMATHNNAYVKNFVEGTLSASHQRQIGLPWSEALVDRTITAVGGTLRTIDLALEYGLACNTAGGTHHAFPDEGSGFCILNDLAVGAQRAMKEYELTSILILDLDVHQGNGTAKFFQDHDRISTASFHCETNFPFDRTEGNWDIEIPAKAGDQEYLTILRENFGTILNRVKPDLVIYDAGVDVHRDDKLGNLQLTDDGIARRDRTVIATLLERRIPIACVIGGGYDEDTSKLARRHAILHLTVKDLLADMAHAE
ncbi:MAG: histone deacetylase [bacterium]